MLSALLGMTGVLAGACEPPPEPPRASPRLSELIENLDGTRNPIRFSYYDDGYLAEVNSARDNDRITWEGERILFTDSTTITYEDDRVVRATSEQIDESVLESTFRYDDSDRFLERVDEGIDRREVLVRDDSGRLVEVQRFREDETPESRIVLRYDEDRIVGYTEEQPNFFDGLSRSHADYIEDDSGRIISVELLFDETPENDAFTRIMDFDYDDEGRLIRVGDRGEEVASFEATYDDGESFGLDLAPIELYRRVPPSCDLYGHVLPDVDVMRAAINPGTTW